MAWSDYSKEEPMEELSTEYGMIKCTYSLNIYE